MAVMIGVALAMVAAVWWLSSTRLALDRGADAARSAADVLQALWLVRGMALAVSSLRMGALHGWRTAVAANVCLIAASWPVVLLAWAASTAPFSTVLLGESLLLAATLALPLIGVGLRRWLHDGERAAIVGTAFGVALAAAVWLKHSSWIMVLS
jgi:hypothetical protein